MISVQRSSANESSLVYRLGRWQADTGYIPASASGLDLISVSRTSAEVKQKLFVWLESGTRDDVDMECDGAASLGTRCVR